MSKEYATNEIKSCLPLEVWCVVGVHPESGSCWTEVVFFTEEEAKKAMNWLGENRPIDYGLGHYDISKSKLTTWKGK